MTRSPIRRKHWGWYQKAGKAAPPEGPKKPTPRKTPRKLEELSHPELEDKLDEAISEYVRRTGSSSGGWARCVTCGAIKHWKEHDCGHYISRVFRWTRWELGNLGIQCRRCNSYLGGAQHIMRAHLVKLHGEEAVVRMEYEATLHGETRRDRVWMIEQIHLWRGKVRALRKAGVGE